MRERLGIPLSSGDRISTWDSPLDRARAQSASAVISEGSCGRRRGLYIAMLYWGVITHPGAGIPSIMATAASAGATSETYVQRRSESNIPQKAI